MARGADVPDEALPVWMKARKTAESAYRTLSALQQRLETAEPEEAAPLYAQVQRARDTWQRAEEYCQESEKAAGVLIHVENLQSVKKRVIVPLAQGIRNMRNAVAVRLKHATPDAVAPFYAAWDAEKNALIRHLTALNDEMDAIIAVNIPEGGGS